MSVAGIEDPNAREEVRVLKLNVEALTILVQDLRTELENLKGRVNGS